MPIVLDYNSVEALGSLAVQAGEASRDRFNQQLLQRYDAQRNQTAAQLQGIEADERQAGLNRQFQANQAAMDRQFTATQQQREIAAEQQRYNQQAQLSALDREARMQRAMLDAGLDAQQGQIDHQRDLQLMDRRHQQRLREQAARAAYGADGGGGGDVSFEDRAEAELQAFSDLIPIETSDTGLAQQDQETQYEKARSLSMLPDARLHELLQNNPEGSWARYIQGVLQQREGAAPRGNGAAAGRRRRAATPARRGGLADQGEGYGSTGLENLAPQDLERLANNPEMLQRYLDQQQSQR